MAEVTVTVLARACHITPRRVQQLVADGMPRTNRGKYDLGVCMSWYIRYLQEQVERRTPSVHATPLPPFVNANSSTPMSVSFACGPLGEETLIVGASPEPGGTGMTTS